MATTEADILAREAAHPTAPPVVEFRRVSKRYDNGMGLDDASFTVGRGEFVFLVGSTGSGKSTVMRLLIKELEPTSGTIRVAGRDLAEITRKKVPYFRRNLGVVFQDYKLLPNRTVYENVAYALQVTGGTRRELPDGEVLTFAHDSAGRLREERGERWDRAERALVHGLRAEGWVDAFRALHGYGERQASWTFAHDRGGWRLDHVLVDGLRPVASAYAHEWRRAGLSDHSALVADLVR